MFSFRRQSEPERIEPTIGNMAEAVSSDRIKMFEIFGDPATPSGAVVNDRTSMRVSAVYRCVSLIAGSIGMLPLPIYQRDGQERERVEHPYWKLLNQDPCPAWTAQSFWEFMVAQMLLRGDGIAYIARNRAGQAVNLIPWPRSQVMVERVSGERTRDPARLHYWFQDTDGYFGTQQEDVLHFPCFGFQSFKQSSGTTILESMSVIEWGARAGIGIAIKGDEHAGRFFSQGGKPEIAVKVPGSMKPEQQEAFRDAWVAKYGGNGPNAIPLVLTEGLDVQELTMTARDQQLIESRQWQVIDIIRAFGVPPHLAGEMTKSTSWGSGIEQQGIGYVMYTLGPHLKRIKDELNRKLFSRGRHFTEHNVDGLMAGDSAAQAEYFGKALGGPGAQGWMTVNEVRKLKNLKPIDGGDEVQMPVQQETTNADSQAAATGA